jgi:hypothetical protein
MNVVKILTQILNNIQKTNEEASKEVSGKKRNRNSPEKTMPRKQLKMKSYWLNKLVPTTNIFEELKEELDDINVNARVEKQSNFVDFWFLSLYQAATINRIGDYVL